MKYTHRTFMGALALMLVLGTASCGKAADVGTDAPGTDDQIGVTEPYVIPSDSTEGTSLDTAIEETPGDVWLVPSEADCPAADREDAPLIMTAEDVSPSQATLVLRAKDGSEFGIGHGPAYSIQRFGEEGWVVVGPKDEKFAEIAYVETASAEHRIAERLDADGAPLTPGYYRVEKNISTHGNGKSVDAT